MSLDPVRRTYEQFGREDPLYAVLSCKGRRHNKWNPEEFFETGRQEVGAVLGYLRDLRVPLRSDRALDFGAGVGRLSQALAEHFSRVIGIDIAESMVLEARRHNRHGERVEYRVNTTDDLATLDSESFDFVYSNITLQHIPPEPAERYIREFFRVLRPGGVTVFQVPNGRAFAPRSLGAFLYTIRRRYFRRFWKVIRGRPPVEMHYIPRARFEQLVDESGGALVDVVDVSRKGKRARNYRYCATKRDARRGLGSA